MREFKIANRITIKSTGINRYLNEISKIPIMTPDEEVEVSKRAITGDEDAVEQLVNANLRFVISVAKQYSGGNITMFEDLINEGNNGLLDAARSFNYQTGFKFISYAVWHIRKYILVYLSTYSRQVRLPQNRIVVISKMKTIESNLANSLERYPTQDEIIDEYLKQNADHYSNNKSRLEMVKENLKIAMIADIKPKPWENSIDDNDNDSLSPSDVYDGSPNLESNIINNIDGMSLIMSYLNKLNISLRDIIIKHHGLDGNDPMSFINISEIRGCSQELVRQKYKKGINLLRYRMLSDGMSIDNFF